MRHLNLPLQKKALHWVHCTAFVSALAASFIVYALPVKAALQLSLKFAFPILGGVAYFFSLAAALSIWAARQAWRDQLLSATLLSPSEYSMGQVAKLKRAAAVALLSLGIARNAISWHFDDVAWVYRIFNALIPRDTWEFTVIGSFLYALGATSDTRFLVDRLVQIILLIQDLVRVSLCLQMGIYFGARCKSWWGALLWTAGGVLIGLPAVWAMFALLWSGISGFSLIDPQTARPIRQLVSFAGYFVFVQLLTIIAVLGTGRTTTRRLDLLNSEASLNGAK